MMLIQRIGLKALRQINRAWKAPRQWRAQRLFHSLNFKPGDIAIDCGANVGDISRELVRRGATVHAFEPNPDAMAELRSHLGNHDQVVCHQKAVSVADEQARLYLHRRVDHDPLGHSAGSSLISAKSNLDPNRYIDVEAVDLARIIRELPGRVRLLKIDVEGYEVKLINHLIDQKLTDRIDFVFCETHEYKIPGLAADCRRLRRRLAREGIEHINLDWV